MENRESIKQAIAIALAIILGALFVARLHGQTEPNIQEPKSELNLQKFLLKKLPTYGLSFISGNADALSENLKWHYYRDFQPTFPHAKESTWNPDLSYRNKYKNGIPNQGPKFWGSTSVFVSVSDPYHAANAISRVSMMTAPLVTLNLYKDSNVKWWWLIVDFACQFISFGAGWHFFDKIILQDNG